MYKLVAIDLDGTMLNSYGEVTENTVNEIRKAKQRGKEIVIASGRTIDSIKAIAEDIGIENGANGLNGRNGFSIRTEKMALIKKNGVIKKWR